MTGRAAGYCAGFNMPGYTNPYGGRLGLGFGWGRGRFSGYGRVPGAWGVPYGAYPYARVCSAEQEKQALERKVGFFENQIASLRKHLEELEGEASEDKK